uniref:HpcH/HpaI aldolase/citrate lyase domain-containing protein n=1 Tax=Amphimedon queenslandica TaxID=400682 RepID=A0A1X7V2B1_AMPQE
MEKGAFHRLFKTTGPAILPVIHVRSEEQAIRNSLLAASEGAQGVFLINHEFPYVQLLPIIVGVREKLPYLWIGVNFLGVTGDIAFKELGKLSSNGYQVDAYWADNGEVDERKPQIQEKAERIKSVREKSGWDGIYFGGTAFKCQRHIQDELVERAASIAIRYMDVVTTSGQATG